MSLIKRLFAMTSVALLLTASLIAWRPTQVNAASDQVTVRLPDFAVTVDGQSIDNTHLTYPLIEYKNITYFPMTWNVGKGMGLNIEWSEEQGLRISSGRGDKSTLEMETNGHFTQGHNYSANIVHFPVTVNRQPVENESETYPLLSFQDITYFPMTWRFAVEMFDWKTSWDDSTGFSITTWQRPYFQWISYDDDNFLYLPYANGGGGMLRVRKDLTGAPQWLMEEEKKSIEQSIMHRGDALHAGAMSYITDDVERKDDSLYYKGIELMSLTSMLEEDAAYYADHPQDRERAVTASGAEKLRYQATHVPYGNGSTFVSLTVYHMMHIPAPYTPHKTYSFIVKDGKATRVDSFPEALQGAAATDNGSWIWSYAPDSMSVRNNGAKGIVMHVSQDGSEVSVNKVLNAQCVRVLQTSANDLIVQAYHLYGPPVESESSGFFRIHPDGTFEKLADLVGMNAYVGIDGELYVTNVNTIVNITQGTSKTWWDYQFWNAPGPRPAN